MLSVIIPLYNEENNIELLHVELSKIKPQISTELEIIFVNDNSSDGTGEKLLKVKKLDKSIRVINHSQRLGQSYAIYSGMCAAKGEIITTIDGDLQNPPSEIPKMYHYFTNSNFDLVNGFRKKRQDTILKKIASKFANYIRAKVLKDGIKDSGCGQRIFTKKLAMKINCFDGYHRFFPALAIINGAKIGEIEIEHHPRNEGKSKYTNYARLKKTVFDLFAVLWMQKRMKNNSNHSWNEDH